MASQSLRARLERDRQNTLPWAARATGPQFQISVAGRAAIQRLQDSLQRDRQRMLLQDLSTLSGLVCALCKLGDTETGLAEHRSQQYTKQQEEQNKAALRKNARDAVNKKIRAISGGMIGTASVYQTLLALDVPVNDRSPAGIRKAVKDAKHFYRPDRHVRKSLSKQLFAEEAFKAICAAASQRNKMI